MKLAVVSDIHGNLPALAAVLADVARERVSAIVNLGDVLSGPLWPAETAERLMTLEWPTIAGNHERQLLAEDRATRGRTDAFTFARLGPAHLAWLASLPKTRWIGRTVFCCHGTPDSDLDYWLETVTPDFGQSGGRGVRRASAVEALQRLGDNAGIASAELLLCGHTHVPRTLRLGDGRLVVNAGSVGLPAYDDVRPHLHYVENGSPHARYALVERGVHGWSVQHRLIAYDWQRAAQQALANGRPDWADALASGWVGRTEADLAA
jgi:predicted phosphodiesterase